MHQNFEDVVALWCCCFLHWYSPKSPSQVHANNTRDYPLYASALPGFYLHLPLPSKDNVAEHFGPEAAQFFEVKGAYISWRLAQSGRPNFYRSLEAIDTTSRIEGLLDRYKKMKAMNKSLLSLYDSTQSGDGEAMTKLKGETYMAIISLISVLQDCDECRAWAFQLWGFLIRKLND